MHDDHRSTRRHFLASNALGIGGVALAWLVQQDDALAKPAKPNLDEPQHGLLPTSPHRPPRAGDDFAVDAGRAEPY